MSNCYICDGPTGDPIIDPRDQQIKPCSVCEVVIQESLDELHSALDIDDDLCYTYIESELVEFEEEVENVRSNRAGL